LSWNECAAAVGKCDEQQLKAASPQSAKDLQRAPLEGVTLAQYFHRTGDVVEAGSL